MKAWGITGVLLIAAIAALIVLGWYEVRRGFSARQEPSAIETLLAKKARNMAVPAAYNLVAIPVAAGLFVRTGFDVPMSAGAIAMSLSKKPSKRNDHESRLDPRIRPGFRLLSRRDTPCVRDI